MMVVRKPGYPAFSELNGCAVRRLRAHGVLLPQSHFLEYRVIGTLVVQEMRPTTLSLRYKSLRFLCILSQWCSYSRL